MSRLVLRRVVLIVMSVLILSSVGCGEPALAANPTPVHQWEQTYAHRLPALVCTRSYEGAYSTNTGNGFYGAYQFNRNTWAGAISRAGYPWLAFALPSNVEAKYQDLAAIQLIRERGLQPWPTPARHCGHLVYRTWAGYWGFR